MKICSHCKKENADDARFCAYCASPFEEEPAVSADQKDAASEDVKTDTRKEPAISQAESSKSEIDSMQPESSTAASPSTPNDQGMKIGFIQPKVIQSPGWEEKKQSVQTGSEQTSSRTGSDRPPRFNPERMPSQSSLPPAPEKPDKEQNRPLILAVAVLAAAALILAGVLVYQNIYLPSHTNSAGDGMQSMEEVSDWDFYDEDESESESASSQRKPIHFSSSDSEVQRQKERLSSVNFFEDDSEEDDPTSESSQVNEKEEGTAYVSQYVMKVRDEPSLEGGQIDRIAENQTVYIDRTKTASDDSLWGHLSNGKGWVCIQDSEQEYLTKKEADSE